MKPILVSGLINVEVTLQIEGFPIAYTPVRYPFFGVSSAVSGVGYNVAKALTTLDDAVRFVSITGQDLAGGQVLAALDEGWCDPSRLYRSGRQARILLDSARETVPACLGARPDEVFFIISGEVRVDIYSLAGKVVSFRELGPGEVFGEYPAIDRGPRSADVVAHAMGPAPAGFRRFPLIGNHEQMMLDFLGESGLGIGPIRGPVGPFRREGLC